MVQIFLLGIIITILINNPMIGFLIFVPFAYYMDIIYKYILSFLLIFLTGVIVESIDPVDDTETN